MSTAENTVLRLPGVAEVSPPAPRAGRKLPLPVGLVLPLLLLALWELAAARAWLPGNLLPAPSVVIATIADLQQRGELIDHVAATTLRVALGFAFGVGAATVLGALCGAVPLA
ncbi:MAG: ABC transporter permease, partial [Rhodospirillaceae bacterium]|nr:ABC transporter permease [Rhodospirillaceae bacterium]